MRYNDLIQVQQFSFDGTLGTWQTIGTLYAAKEDKNRLTVYAQHATAKRMSSTFYVRNEMEITMQHRIIWDDAPYMISGINAKGTEMLEIVGVEAYYVDCVVERQVEVYDALNRPQSVKSLVYRIPAILAEKYVEYIKDEQKGENEISYILITPKIINIIAGDIVKIDTDNYVAVLGHKLEPYHNEYEIRRQADV